MCKRGGKRRTFSASMRCACERCEREKDVKFLCCWILAFENLETFMRCVVISQSEEDNHLSFCEHKK